MRFPRGALLGFIGVVLFLVGCSEGEGSAIVGAASSAEGAKDRIEIVCTTGMVADLVRHVGGERVKVFQLMGEGVDPHLYKASTRDVIKLFRADLIFYSGLHLEGKMADVFERLARRKPTYSLTAHTPEDRLLRLGPEQFDPHAWFDVDLWSAGLDVAEQALVKFDSDHAAEYRAGAKSYRSTLAELHAWCRQQVRSIPAKRRVLVTAHDAFHYFGRAYGMQVKAIQGVSTESEAGVKEVNELVDFLVTRGIKAVFVESSVSERNIRALVEGCAARSHHVEIGGELFSDALGQEGTVEGTYAGMVRHNVQAITRALR